ncbi:MULTISPECIES: four-helix bundle copper-binding protein [Virgibacillus]|uniref:Four-helix bundle copper-binding protein n=2 Tax=Virgibacillus TaxID=84406 RepID=A0A024QFD5_9BACI|nr:MULTISPECIES: four-helix bundle copper-binding protein [Virgibacillus]EQB37195.1 hypothetical protein M948_09950 [Virgibacillus sp. CM-4]MYL43442.1 four-helix bundle copper-binding protein [Virgibacillus massiliensis]GGJ71431.1 putative cysteine-rich protein YhjQ [Virgibacillus kapii]CDQ41209.1 hypothetical protein BN990_03564 [Virgibacillus massiliensis]
MPHQQQELISTLHECMTACNHCYNACLQEEDIKMMTTCIQLDRECADICGYVEQAITRGTPFLSELTNVCAAICEACGKECKKHAHNHCQHCAEKCFTCAEACKAA